MAVEEIYKPESRWDQAAFQKLRATWSPERIADDEKKLKEIFALAADCPLLAEALEWATQHGVKFFIDRQAVNVGGYYQLGTGVLALVPASLGHKPRAAEVLVHEIRHAWQDYNGLISWDGAAPHEGNFSNFFINNALIEADAMAYGNLASRQVILSQTKREMETEARPVHLNWSLKEQALLSDESARFKERFLAWFEDDWRMNFYGDYFSKAYGKKWDIYKGELPARNAEFTTKEPHIEGMNIHNIQDVLRLGVNFSGTENYLAKLQPDILPKQILRPSLANTFWGAARHDQRKLTSQLRKAHLRKKLAPENRKKHHSWP